MFNNVFLLLIHNNLGGKITKYKVSITHSSLLLINSYNSYFDFSSKMNLYPTPFNNHMGVKLGDTRYDVSFLKRIGLP